MNQTITNNEVHENACSGNYSLRGNPKQKLTLRKATVAAFTVALLLVASLCQAQRKMENLGRGTVASRTSTSQVFVSWRILGREISGTTYNLYRGTTRIASNLNVSNFTDNISTNSTYQVAAVVGGVEQAKAPAVSVKGTIYGTNTVPSLQVPIVYTTGYTPQHIYAGDLDGNGEMDFVLVNHPDDPAKTQFVEAYKSNGTFLWRMDMGPNSVNKYNIEPGSSTINIGHGDNMTVYDMNSDGRAEVVIRVANGVKFGNGTTFSHSDNNRQFIYIVDGLTGAPLNYKAVPTNFIADGPMNGHMGIAYLDGINPSVVWNSKNRIGDGNFNDMITAYNWSGSTLNLLWTFLHPGNSTLNTPQGHNIRLVDVDGDGKDEVIPFGFVLEETGALKYSMGTNSGVVHGDRFHIGDLDPARAGLEGYAIQQDNPSGLAWVYYDARTGAILKSQNPGGIVDYARGFAGDLDPRSPGYEFWTFTDGIYNVSGSRTSSALPASYPNLRIFWDGDALSENMDNLKMTKWNYLNNYEDRLLNFRDVIQTARNVPGFYGDILGDWREEVVYLASDKRKLLVFTPTTPTSIRMYTLLHNRAYRNCLTTKGYIQSNMADVYIGNGMATPPAPNIVYASRTTATGVFQSIDQNDISQISLASLNEGIEASSETVVYPNPSSDAFKVNVNGTFDYVIYDQTGKKVESGSGSNNVRIGESLKPAIYILNVTTSAGEIKKYKLVKQ